MNSDLNYNLLKVLLLLNQHRNLKKVALIIGKTESAVSKYLTKMREQIGDPLFIRTSHGLEPTHVLTSLLPSFESGLSVIDNALFEKGSFSSENYTETIRVAIHSAVMSYYSTEIYTAIRQAFPKPMIALETWTESTEQRILDSKVHIGVSFMHEERVKSIYQSKLTDTTMVAAVSPNSSINSWEDAIRAPLISFKVNDFNHSRQYFIEHCKKAGITLNYRVSTDDFATATRLIQQEDMVFICLKRLISPYNVKLIPIPENFQGKYPFVSCMKLANRNSPLHCLLDDIIRLVVV